LRCDIVTKQRLARCLGQRNNGRVLQLSLQSNGVETLAHVFQASDNLNTILLLDFRFDNGRGRKDAQTGLTEDSEERTIFEFTHDPWANPCGIEPLFEGTS